MGQGPDEKHRLTQKRLERERRRKVVAANILAGLTYREIAEALNVSLGTVAGDFRAILKAWQKHYEGDMDRWVKVQLRRLDVMLNALWSKAKDGDETAIDRVLKIMERQARLLGLDAPTDVNLQVGGRLDITADDLAAARDAARVLEQALLADNAAAPPLAGGDTEGGEAPPSG